MEKMTLKEIRRYVQFGVAVNITNVNNPGVIREPLEKLGFSTGAYGLSGALFKGVESGTLYAITARSSALFLFW